MRGTNFAGVANSSILNPKDKRDRFEDNKKILSPELMTDNLGKHGPSVIYNTIDQNKISKAISRRATHNISFTKAKRPIGSDFSRFKNYPGPGKYN